ncbi:MAG: GvpL/GvpF family gas vesicle protein [bacterium]|nr:GvpL/GvpF family gas vesicle protein [bacterium]
MVESKYIYGVIGTGERKEFGPIGVGGKGDIVYTIPYKDIAAVISDSPVTVYSELTKDAVMPYLFAHQVVIEKTMKESTIIPFKFGTALRSMEEVKNVLKKGYTLFKDSLKTLENKVEMDIVVGWNKDVIFKDIANEEGIKRFRRDIELNPSEEDKIILGKIVEGVLNEKKKECAKEIEADLCKCADRWAKHETLDSTMIANVSLLIDKDKEKGLDNKLNELNKKYEERVNFKCVGPLPSYSFNTIELKKPEFEVIDKARKELTLGEEATKIEIRDVYRRLVQKYHPDKSPHLGGEQFKEITGAYKMLSEYCQEVRPQGDKCSFREADVKNAVIIKVLDEGEK